MDDRQKQKKKEKTRPEEAQEQQQQAWAKQAAEQWRRGVARKRQ